MWCELRKDLHIQGIQFSQSVGFHPEVTCNIVTVDNIFYFTVFKMMLNTCDQCSSYEHPHIQSMRTNTTHRICVHTHLNAVHDDFFVVFNESIASSPLFGVEWSFRTFKPVMSLDQGTSGVILQINAALNWLLVLLIPGLIRQNLKSGTELWCCVLIK